MKTWELFRCGLPGVGTAGADEFRHVSICGIDVGACEFLRARLGGDGLLIPDIDTLAAPCTPLLII